MSFDPDQLSQCVGCGLCLTSCPTYQVTELERHGPRGRIAAMRLVQDGEVDVLDESYLESIETCVQCRACEVACPSDVLFGALIERANADIAAAPAADVPPRRRARRALQRAGLTLVEHRGSLTAVTALLRLSQRLRVDRLLPRRLRVPMAVGADGPLRAPAPVDGARPAVLFRGCVMDQWFRPVHEATAIVLAAAGYSVATEPAPPCCGALRLHGGDEAGARRLAGQVISAYSGTQGPIVVDSAGCGAAMKEYGRLLGTPEAQRFAERVVDFGEAVTPDDLPRLGRVDLHVAYQAPCHLLNVQRVADRPLALLRAVPGLTVSEPADGHACCGAGGAYSLLQPEFSSALSTRKADSLRATGADVVASGNPGCAMSIGQSGFDVLHPAQLIARSLEAAARASRAPSPSPAAQPGPPPSDPV